MRHTRCWLGRSCIKPASHCNPVSGRSTSTPRVRYAMLTSRGECQLNHVSSYVCANLVPWSWIPALGAGCEGDFLPSNSRALLPCKIRNGLHPVAQALFIPLIARFQAEGDAPMSFIRHSLETFGKTPEKEDIIMSAAGSLFSGTSLHCSPFSLTAC